MKLFIISRKITNADGSTARFEYLCRRSSFRTRWSTNPNDARTFSKFYIAKNVASNNSGNDKLHIITVIGKIENSISYDAIKAIDNAAYTDYQRRQNFINDLQALIK